MREGIFMNFDIDNRQEQYDITEEMINLIERVIRESLRVEGIGENYEVSISFVDNEEIKALNREFRGVDRETDVLSFPMEDEFDFSIPLLGDIVISLEKADEQAKDYGHTLEREVAYLTCHSMFHLMGYDHMNEDEKRIMREKEKEVMRNLRIFKNI
jgi:probable rRNA maturation factor